WSWIYVMSYDVQTGRMSRAAHQESVTGGNRSLFYADSEEAYDTYFTQQALQRLGQV
ncbi:MAG: hypothetical protein ACPHCJ_08975, partial [Oceanococcaceae bacterium]